MWSTLYNNTHLSPEFFTLLPIGYTDAKAYILGIFKPPAWMQGLENALKCSNKVYNEVVVLSNCHISSQANSSNKSDDGFLRHN